MSGNSDTFQTRSPRVAPLAPIDDFPHLFHLYHLFLYQSHAHLRCQVSPVFLTVLHFKRSNNYSPTLMGIIVLVFTTQVNSQPQMFTLFLQMGKIRAKQSGKPFCFARRSIARAIPSLSSQSERALSTIACVVYMYTVKAPVSGHPREAEIVSVSGAGRLPEWVNTNTEWEPGKNGFRQGVHK